MKHLLGRVLTLVVTLSISMGSSSATYTGNDLQKHCADEDDLFEFARCVDYIHGASDAHLITSALNKQDSLYCLPEKATHGQTAKVVSKYLKNHPEKLHETAIGLVYLALRSAFPCEAGQ